MKKTLKKGFTLVELVIVIAVIAILSAVLIPTFGNVISNAKKSSAQSEASNAISQYITNQATAGQPADLPDGYIIVYSKKAALATVATASINATTGTAAVATPAYATASGIDYIFSFKGGRVDLIKVDNKDTDGKQLAVNTGDGIFNTTNYRSPADVKIYSATSYEMNGIYFLDGEISVSGDNTVISSKIVLVTAVA